ncbi:MFS transporter [Gemmatimonas phototrophica]|uniref:MFS transporter n=1 Tax=Gemmatimonas phototrophica TaxID=1379270 RepID=UPI0005BC05A4|nr:tetracycline resistance MFS efflux pump [Gemmatimonas phototrophica]
MSNSNAPSHHTDEHPVDDGKSAFGKLAVLMVTAFIDMLGLLMILPLLPFYAKSLGAGGAVVGLLVSSFSIAQLLSAPVWGRFSDKYGRRPALMVGLGASAIAYVVFAYADSLWLLFLSRIVQGAGGGTVSVIQAYVADATRPEDRAKSLGWLSAATNAGVALGPVIGSWMQLFSKHTPGLVAAGLCVVNMGFAWKYLTEIRKPGAAPGTSKPKGSREAVFRVVSHPSEPASRLILIYALAIGAFQGTTAILALFLADRFGVTEATIGYFFMYIGVLSVVVRALMLGKLVDRIGEPRLSRAGLLFLAAGLVGLSISPNLPVLALSVGLLPLGTAFTFPCVTAMLSRVVSSAERGLYMGVQQTFGGVTRVVFPIILGVAFDAFGKQSPFWISAAVVLATLLMGRDLELYAPKRVMPTG